MTSTLVDLETHLTDYTYNGRWFFGMPYHGPFSNLVLGKCFATADSTMLGIINFDDQDRAERLFAKIMKEHRVEDKGPLLTVHVGKKQAHLLIGQEIPTEKGHILVMGGKRIVSRKLEDVLKEARDSNGLVIVDHPLLEMNALAKLAYRTVGYNAVRLSLSEEEIEKYRTHIDGVEIWNGNSRTNDEAAAIAQKYSIPGFVTSDSHTVRDIFNSYMGFDNLDFSDANKLIASIRKGVRNAQNTKTHNGILEGIRHGAICVVELGLEKTGLVKRD